MRIVVDTNVLVSGVLNPHGSPGRCLDLILDGDLIPLFDDRILAEYRDVLLRPRFGFDPRDVDALVDYFIAEGQALGAQDPRKTLAPAPAAPASAAPVSVTYWGLRITTIKCRGGACLPPGGG